VTGLTQMRLALQQCRNDSVSHRNARPQISVSLSKGRFARSRLAAAGAIVPRASVRRILSGFDRHLVSAAQRDNFVQAYPSG
jgi:hypothetical protein